VNATSSSDTSPSFPSVLVALPPTQNHHRCPFALLKSEDPPAPVVTGACSNAISLRVTAACFASLDLLQPVLLAALPDSSLLMSCRPLKPPPSSYLPVSGSGTVTTSFHYMSPLPLAFPNPAPLPVNPAL
jgi:hypothetical protein